MKSCTDIFACKQPHNNKKIFACEIFKSKFLPFSSGWSGEESQWLLMFYSCVRCGEGFLDSRVDSHILCFVLWVRRYFIVCGSCGESSSNANNQEMPRNRRTSNTCWSKAFDCLLLTHRWTFLRHNFRRLRRQIAVLIKQTLNSVEVNLKPVVVTVDVFQLKVQRWCMECCW